MTINLDAMKRAEREIKLEINERLYRQGSITKSMYENAKKTLLKG